MWTVTNWRCEAYRYSRGVDRARWIVAKRTPAGSSDAGTHEIGFAATAIDLDDLGATCCELHLYSIVTQI